MGCDLPQEGEKYMGYHKSYKGLSELPEVKELIEVFSKRKYYLGYSEDIGMRMQKRFTEIHFIPEIDRLRLCIHDDGMGDKETEKALKIGAEIVKKYGYRQGNHIIRKDRSLEESEDEYYKYFE